MIRLKRPARTSCFYRSHFRLVYVGLNDRNSPKPPGCKYLNETEHKRKEKMKIEKGPK